MKDGTRTNDSRKTDDTRQDLVKAATHLFAKQGYHATSVKEIADKAKVNISLVSYYFGGKEGLYKACLEPFAESKLSFLTDQMGGKISSRDEYKFRMKMIMKDMISDEMRNGEMGQIVRREAESNDGIVREIVKKVLAPVFAAFTDFIHYGQTKGYLRKDIEPRHLAMMIVGPLQHTMGSDPLRKCMFGDSIKDEGQQEILLNTVFEIFFNGALKS